MKLWKFKEEGDRFTMDQYKWIRIRIKNSDGNIQKENVMENQDVMENGIIMENIKEAIIEDSSESECDYSSHSEGDTLSESELDSDISVIEIDSDVEDKSGKNKLYFKGVKRKLNWSLLGNKDIEETSWEAIQNKLLKCTDFKQFEEAVATIKEPLLIASHIYNTSSECNLIDDIALHFLLNDSPSGYLPVRNFGDGNCFAQSISQFIYGTEDHHLEVRIRIILEAVRNKQLYLDQNVLLKGLLCSPDWLLATQYAACLEHYKDSLSNEEIYENEVCGIICSGAYTGIWQFHQISNVLKRPIGSIFPDKVNSVAWSHLNRVVLPTCETQREILYIQWTPFRYEAPNWDAKHFVPLKKGWL